MKWNGVKPGPGGQRARIPCRGRREGRGDDDELERMLGAGSEGRQAGVLGLSRPARRSIRCARPRRHYCVGDPGSAAVARGCAGLRGCGRSPRMPPSVNPPLRLGEGSGSGSESWPNGGLS